MVRRPCPARNARAAGARTRRASPSARGVARRSSHPPRPSSGGARAAARGSSRASGSAVIAVCRSRRRCPSPSPPRTRLPCCSAHPVRRWRRRHLPSGLSRRRPHHPDLRPRRAGLPPPGAASASYRCDTMASPARPTRSGRRVRCAAAPRASSDFRTMPPSRPSMRGSRSGVRPCSWRTAVASTARSCACAPRARSRAATSYASGGSCCEWTPCPGVRRADPAHAPGARRTRATASG